MRALAFAFFSIFSIILAGCTFFQGNSGTSTSLTLAFQNSRYAEVEPCGCDTTPWGGMDRELNALEKFKSKKNQGPVVYLESGPSLVNPDQKTLSQSLRGLKAKAIVPLQNQLGVDVFSPSLEDLSLLPASEVADLIGASKFEWVATGLDLKDKSLKLKPFALVQKEKYRLLVVSFYPALGENYKNLLTQTEGLEAIRKIAGEKKDQFDALIVLSHTGDLKSDEAAMNALGLASIWIGSDYNEMRTESVRSQDLKSALFEGGKNGRFFQTVEMDLKASAKGFHSPKEEEENKKRLEKLTPKIAQQTDQEEKEFYQMEQKLLQSVIGSVDGSVGYHYQATPLKEEDFGQANSLTEDIKALQAKMKAEAIKSN